MNAVQKSEQNGLTLIELIIVISIFSILLATALPMAQTFIHNQRKIAEVNLLIGALNYTRGEAVLQRRALRLCSGSAANGCHDEWLWRGDWLVLPNVTTSTATHEPRRVFAHSGDFFWRWRGAGGLPFIRFKPDGSAAGRNGTFTLCHEDKALHQVVINFAGRIRSQDAPSNARCD